jgi:hypothetical protein
MLLYLHMRVRQNGHHCIAFLLKRQHELFRTYTITFFFSGSVPLGNNMGVGHTVVSRWYILGTIPTHRPKQAEGFWCISVKLRQESMTSHIQKTRRLFAHTNLSTFYSLFYSIKPLQCPVISVWPTCYCLYPCFLCYILISDHLQDHSLSHDLAYCLSIASHHFFIPLIIASSLSLWWTVSFCLQ